MVLLENCTLTVIQDMMNVLRYLTASIITAKKIISSDSKLQENVFKMTPEVFTIVSVGMKNPG